MNYFSRYALAVCVIVYMTGIILLHLVGLFPRAGIDDLSRLIGASQVTVTGRVLDSPVIRWNQTRFLFQGKAVPLEAFGGKAVVTLAFIDDELAPGDKITVRGWLSAPRQPSRSRAFDEQSYWATRGVFSMLKVWSPAGFAVVRRSSPWSLNRLAWRFHRRFRQFWERVLSPDEAGLLLGITMGARGVLSPALKEACIRAGVYHIVVVSGQNMSLIVGLGLGLLILLQVPRRHAFWICAMPIIFYTAAVGGDPPVMRAAVMALIGLFTMALGRDIPRYYPLLLAAGWILIREPEALLGASFQLSFGATLSIMAILPLWDAGAGRRQRWRHWLKEAGLMGITVHIGIWPLLVYYFHRLSFAGFLANWTLFPMSGILMVFGLFFGTWGVLLPSTLPPVCLQMMGCAVRMTLRFIEWMAARPYAVRSVSPPPAWVIALYYGTLFGILLMISRRKNHEQIRPTGRPRLQRG